MRHLPVLLRLDLGDDPVAFLELIMNPPRKRLFIVNPICYRIFRNEHRVRMPGIFERNPVSTAVLPLTQHVPALSCLSPSLDSVLNLYECVALLNCAAVTSVINDVFKEQVTVAFFIEL